MRRNLKKIWVSWLVVIPFTCVSEGRVFDVLYVYGLQLWLNPRILVFAKSSLKLIVF
jgi:hypothetical protein